MRPDDEQRDPTPPTPLTPPTDATADDLSLALIEEQADHAIRRLWHDGRWFFSVIDVIGVLTDSPNPGNYWRVLKSRLKDEEFVELLAQCCPLKLPAPDGKLRETDCADFATMVSLIHLIPALRRRANDTPLDQCDAPSGVCGIYTILNSITHEQYIGSSHDILARFAQHQALLRRGKHHALRLQEAWDTLGQEAFQFVIVEAGVTSAQLAAREQHYLDAALPAYNTAEVARNSLSLPPIAATRVQQVLRALYERQRTTTPTPLFHLLREALIAGIVIPGPNFAVLTQAEASGIATWEALGTFLQHDQLTS